MSLERDRSKNSAFMSKVSIVSAVPLSQAYGFISFASLRIQMISQQMHQLNCFSFQTSFINKNVLSSRWWITMSRFVDIIFEFICHTHSLVNCSLIHSFHVLHYSIFMLLKLVKFSFHFTY